MAKADLHLHSKHSRVSPEWFLTQLGVQESYTEVESVYRLAKRSGMDFVTLTDHDAIDGALALRELSPADTFVSVETTTRFPEDGCKVHLLLYGIDERQFREVAEVRRDIYELREYVRAERIAHSVAHATYDMNGKLDLAKLERLILLFDVFEGVNGSRNRHHNLIWSTILRRLRPADIERLFARHRIEPYGATPWVKGLTGGSDDHAGLLIGSAYTIADAASPTEFVRQIETKRSDGAGEHGDYKKMAFSMYKIAYEYSRAQTDASRAPGMIGLFNDVLFGDRRLSFSERLQLRRLRKHKDRRLQVLGRVFGAYLDATKTSGPLSANAKIGHLHEQLAEAVDELFRLFVATIRAELKAGDSIGLVKRIAGALPSAFLSVPFLTTARILFAANGLVYDLEERFLGTPSSREKRVLWFTDTIADLNGVSVTLLSLAACAARHRLPFNLVACAPDLTGGPEFPPNILQLPCVSSHVSELYPAYRLRVPSLLKSIELIHERNPHAIVVSTPGPVGLLGVLAARLLGVRCTGIYHTDFQVQMEYLAGSGLTPMLAETYSRWFYSSMDEIRVPTEEYMGILAERGYDRRKMKLFRRGIDLRHFGYCEEAARETQRRYRIADGFTLLWAGRVSKDKNIDFLASLYEAVSRVDAPINLIVAGDGPALEPLRGRLAGLPRVHLVGKVAREALKGFYSLADVFVFPSDMDTFGMVILESQACGLPAIVTDRGGPREIVRDGVTGSVLSLREPRAWVEKILELRRMKIESPASYRDYRSRILDHVGESHTLDAALADLLGTELPAEPPLESRAVARRVA